MQEVKKWLHYRYWQKFKAISGEGFAEYIQMPKT